VVADGATETIAARLGQTNLEDVYLHLNAHPDPVDANTGA
jgi:hypothetical protein